jgi:hypothetical protein
MNIDKFQGNLNYKNRAERNESLAGFISCHPDIETILNIGGGGKRHLELALKKLNIKKNVFEVDMVGDCDWITNLDEIDKLMFKDNEFDLVCCMDVLEHLEQFHLICHELIRVTRNQVVISLPVSSAEILGNIFFNNYPESKRNNTGYYSKFYGLPFEAPEDRHRWWLTYDDIERFFNNLSNEIGLKFKIIKPKLNWKKFIAERLFGTRIINNFFTPHVWVILEKSSQTARKL